MSEKKKGSACTICGKPAAVPGLRPFCSRRCADIDLGRWLGERYVVTEPVAAEDEADRPANQDSGED